MWAVLLLDCHLEKNKTILGPPSGFSRVQKFTKLEFAGGLVG